jgi:hypothetical protein
MLKPIETVYQGYRLRSRLEARYGVFFDTLGLPWRYEAEGFDVGGVAYLPDFYLPEWDVYFEVKPTLPKTVFTEGPDGGQVRVLPVFEEGRHTDFGKFLLASSALMGEEKGAKRPRLYLLCGTPGFPSLQRYKGLWKLNDGSVVLHAVGPVDGAVLLPVEAWSEQTETGLIEPWPFYRGGLQGDGWAEVPYYPDTSVPHRYVGDGRDYASPRLMNAYAAARGARFEHGECGAAKK